jgi:type I restriction enzyme, S subunit
MSKELPKDWKKVTLGEIATYVNGKAFKPSEWSRDGVPIIRIQNLNREKSEFNYCNFKVDDKFFVNNDDLLFAWSGTPDTSFGAHIWKGGMAVLNQHIFKIIIDENQIEKLYYLYALNHKVKEFVSKAHGTAGLAHITKKKFEESEIYLPPKSTQQAIVCKIEELFSEIENGIKSLFTAQQQLKIYRQSVLKWAFEGKLTNENVKDGGLPEGWKMVRLGDVCDKIQDGSHFSPQVQYDEPGQNRFKYITAKNIRNDYMDFRKVTYVDKDFHDSIYGRCNPEFGDVLLTKDGINTGEVTLNTLHEPFSLLSSVCIFKTKKKTLSSEFLKYFIQSPYGSKAILNSMTGTAIKRIVLRKIKDSQIVLPPIMEQYKIVQEIETRLSVADKMEESITQSLQQAVALKQSILKKAFEGRLI